MDSIIIFFVIMIGAAEAAHLTGVVFHKSLGQCGAVMTVCLAAGFAALTMISFWKYRTRRDARQESDAGGGPVRFEPAPEPAEHRHRKNSEKILICVLFALMISQLLFVLYGGKIYRPGDMTVETVESFLQTGGIYEVNPLTGNPYTAGLPFRYEILCLPTLYALGCKAFRVSAQVMVWKIAPTAILLLSYTAYAALAKSLFPGSRSRRLLFLVAVSVLTWVGTYGEWMDGFGLLFAGWRGMTIRNAVLVPYAAASCIRKKYFGVVLCCAAEACLVWTLYGLGACVIVATGLLLCGFLPVKRKEAKKEGEQ